MRLKMTFVPEDVSTKSDDIKSVAALFATLFQNVTTYYKGLRHSAEGTMLRQVAAPDINKRQQFVAFQTHLTARSTLGFQTFDAFKKSIEGQLNMRYRAAALHGADPMVGVRTPAVVLELNSELKNGSQVMKVTVTNPQTRVVSIEKIGEILVEEARFEPCATVYDDVQNQVYTRIGGSPREYIKLPLGDGVYVRRYVIRGLNVNDAKDIGAGNALEAASSDTDFTEVEIQTAERKGRFPTGSSGEISLGNQMLSHTRGWKKRFISTTLTHKKIVSTKGEFNSAFGVLLIDLAKVDVTTIFDIHTPRALQHYGVFNGNLLQLPNISSAKYRNLQDEKLLSAYDAVRTRELLIKGSIPFEALLYEDLGERVVAIGCKDFHRKDNLAEQLLDLWKKNALPAPVKDELQYEISGAKWVFYCFTNPATAKLALDQADAFIHTSGVKATTLSTMHSFGFPSAIPAGATTA